MLAVKKALQLLAKEENEDEGYDADFAGYKVVEKLTPPLISAQTYASRFNLPDVDAILRTSGEIRLSGFHLWESNNAELCFVNPKWPELNEVQFLEAALELSMRQRRNGL